MKKLVYLLFGILLMLFGGIAFANISVSPLKYEYIINPGESLSGEITVTNNEKTAITLYTSKEDFVAGDEKGTPKFVPEKESSSNLFGLTNWLEISQNNITLAPGESREISFLVKVPENGEPGGHYGAIFFTQGGGQGQVAITARLGVLILINVPGDVKVDGNLTSFELGKKTGDNFISQTNFDGLPIYFPIKIKNNGNVHIKPYGKITIIDSEGNVLKNISKEPMLSQGGAYLGDKLVDYILVNDKDGNVLPNSQRLFEPIWSGFYYESVNENGIKELKYRSIEDYYKNKSKELTKSLNFLQTIKQIKITKKFTAQMILAFEGKNGEKKEFKEQKDFNITFVDSVVTYNFYIIGIIGLIILGLLYYMIIGKRNYEKKLKEKIMKELNNN